MDDWQLADTLMVGFYALVLIGCTWVERRLSRRARQAEQKERAAAVAAEAEAITRSWEQFAERNKDELAARRNLRERRAWEAMMKARRN